MTPDERALVARDSNQGVAIVAVAIVALFGGIALIGIIAAIAIPGLLRARMAGNEASAIGSMRAMSSAQATFRLDARGPLRDARVPDGAVVLPQRGRHASRRCRSSIAPRPSPVRAAATSFRLLVSPDQNRFVYWAEPAQAGQTGERAFCVTETFTVLEYLRLPLPRPVRAVGGGAGAARRAAGRCNLPACHNSPRFPPAARRSRSCRRWPSEP